MNFTPVYSYIDIYVTDNNGRQLHGIIVFEDKESEGLNELEYNYDSNTQRLDLHGYDVRDFDNIEELKEDLHQLLYNKRRDSIRKDDVMRSPLEALVCTVGHYWRKFSS